MATLKGGPATLPGASTSPMTFGGEAFRSITARVSGFGSATIFTTPFTRLTLLSFEETAIWAEAGATGGKTAAAGSQRGFNILLFPWGVPGGRRRINAGRAPPPN